MNTLQFPGQFRGGVPEGFTIDANGAVLDSQARALMAATPGLDYLAAVKQAATVMLSGAPALTPRPSVPAGREATCTDPKPWRLPEGCVVSPDRAALDQRARSLMASTPGLDYLSAVKQAERATSRSMSALHPGALSAGPGTVMQQAAGSGSLAGECLSPEDRSKLYSALFVADIACRQAFVDRSFHDVLRVHMRNVRGEGNSQSIAEASAWYNSNLDSLNQINAEVQQSRARMAQIAADRLASERARNSGSEQ